jgi:hypothetical protein
VAVLSRAEKFRLFCLILVSGAAGIWTAAPSVGLAQEPDEYQVKAVFLFNLAKFVEWPTEALQDGSEPISICVFGEDPFNGGLEAIVADHLINGRRIAVRHITNVRQANSCRMLFVPSSERKRIPAIVAAIDVPGVLTVGEADALAIKGIAITFTRPGRRIGIEINLEAAELEKITISSKLLSLAHVTKSDALGAHTLPTSSRRSTR